MSAFPKIVIGTYEEFVLGYNLERENEKKKKIIFHQTFATHSHQASVRCIATHKNLMASSGADEYINIYDMAAMEVSTVINYHNSTVTCLEFTPDGSHLVTANQNGDIAIFQCKDWTLVKLWKEAHKHACGILSMSIHPSGTLLITTGADNVVRFWNLVKGRLAYATNFSKKCSVGNSLNFAIWNRNGSFYAVCVGNKVEIYKTQTAAVVYEIHTKTRITSSAFTKKNLFCLGTEDGSFEIHSVQQKSLLLTKEAHKVRIKSLLSFDINFIKDGKKKLQNYIVSVDSKGTIKLWFLKKKDSDYSLILKSESNCDCRITCLAMVAPDAVKMEEEDSSDKIQGEDSTEQSIASEENCLDFSKEIKENNNSKNHLVAQKATKISKINNSSVPKIRNGAKMKRKSFESDLKNKKVKKNHVVNGKKG